MKEKPGRRRDGPVPNERVRMPRSREGTGELRRINGALKAEIAERKEAEEALQRADQRISEILSSITDCHFNLDKEWRFTAINDRALRYFGMKEERFLGKPYWEIFPAAVSSVLEKQYMKAVSRQVPVHFEHHSVVVARWAEVHAYPSEEGLSVYFRDITDRKMMEEELRRSRDKLEERIQERTEELAVANEELQSQIEQCHRIQVELRESENRLRQLSTELLNSHEKERKRVAQEIHDSIGGSLAAAKFKAEEALARLAGGDSKARSALQEVVPVIQGAIDEARRIQMNLRPSILDDLGLLATIDWFCRQFESTYATINIRKEIALREEEVPDSLKTVIFRVMQEAMNNVAKHSKASVAVLFLRKYDHAIQLVVQDSGQGFDRAETRLREGTGRGLGLESMKERTELSGGSFSIESARGAGTVIRATWPV